MPVVTFLGIKIDALALVALNVNSFFLLRMFLRRLISLSTSVSELSHHISLSADARADIRWWLDFLPTWNGISVIPPPPVSNVDLHLFTDASSIPDLVERQSTSCAKK